MSFRPYPGVDWLQFRPLSSGGFELIDTRSGQTYYACCPDALHQSAADLSGSKTHVGLGDVLHSVAKFFGLRRCSSCADRHIAANRAVPRLWRRR